MVLAALAMMTGLADPFGAARWLTVPEPVAPLSSSRWIWIRSDAFPEPGRHADEGTVEFQAEWRIAGEVARAMLTFAADNRATVTINGQQVGGNENWSSPTELDVTVHLRAGSNLILFAATNTAGTNQNPAGLIVHGMAKTADGRDYVLDSNREWHSDQGEVTEIGPAETPPWNLRDKEGPSPIFRHEFDAPAPVKQATAYVIGLGHFDLLVNGQRQGEGYLNQPWSQFDRRIYWTEFDVTESLKQGRNAVLVTMGNGFFRVGAPGTGRYVKADMMCDYSEGQPYLLRAAISLEYADGTHETILSDEHWRWRLGPYRLSHVYAGEDYDAREWDDSWTRPGAQLEGWTNATLAHPPSAQLAPIDWPPILATDAWTPSQIVERDGNRISYIFDQNAMAVVRFRVRGQRGQTITVTPSEVISPEGDVQQLNLWGGHAVGNYTLRGSGSESYEWRFFYHGFQYVEVKGAVLPNQPNPDRLPVIENLEMVPIRTANRTTGEFVSGNVTYNGTHRIIDWAIQSNMSYVLSDCPQREKAGWLEVAHLMFPSIAYRYDVKDWYRKICRDMRDAQLSNGQVLTVAPRVLLLPPSSPYAFTTEWGAASVLVPWQAYQWYGDRTFLEENYAMMVRYVDYLRSVSPTGIAPSGLGDWYDYGHGQPPGPSRFTPTQLTSTATYALCLRAVRDAAEVLEESADVVRLEAEIERVRTAFIAAYYDAESATFTNTGSVQSGSAMALCAGLAPEADRDRILANIVLELRDRGYQQTPGDVGHVYLIRALAEAGRSDILHRVYQQTGTGSYGGILAKGLTTLPETWDAITVGSNSLNHCMLGHVMEWFYGYVVGIRATPNSVGWNEFIIAPEPGNLSMARGKIETPRGVVTVEWEKGPEGFVIKGTVPDGVSATLIMPGTSDHVTVNGKPSGRRTSLAPGSFRAIQQ
ncbi:MAG: family 78 glycoside hydrolase catalytic domain [Fimbriimonadaceae bacterium]|nr:family 78 glycoside hydrolase catalytic domain [Fimbriimonadaceae bacterium]